MKRILTLIFSLVMVLSAVTLPTQAVNVKPTPPSWVDAQEYAVFEGDPVYQEENWAKVLQARADAEAGGSIPDDDALSIGRSAGAYYEKGLILLRCAANGNDRKAYYEGRLAFQSISDSELDSEEKALVDLWFWRAMVLQQYYREPTRQLKQGLGGKLEEWDMTLEEFLDTPLMDVVTADERAMLAQAVESYFNRVELRIDNVKVRPDDVELFIENGRTMAPIRLVGEYLGADVSWDAELNAARLVRAGTEILLPIGKKMAYVNGTAVPLDAETYIKDGRTIVPVRYVAEFFGQTVEWNAELRSVMIEEDKSVAKGSNLEQWALPMGAMIPAVAYTAPTHFGRSRGAVALMGYETVPVAQSARKTLAESWGIQDRASLVSTIMVMTENGHNSEFLKLAESGKADAYTEALFKKWGERGILCWDLFRMSNLAQFGYEAGYVTYAEALALIEPAAKRLQETFSSWESAYENYLDGYGWWSGTGYVGQNVWNTERGQLFLLMMDRDDLAPVFDDTLFTQGVKGIPGLTAEQIRASV